MDNRIFENMSDVGRGANLVGLAMMSVSSAALFVSRTIAARRRNHITPNTTVVDMPKTHSN